MHYFPDMVSLLGAVLEYRAEVEIATEYAQIEGITLIELLEKARSYRNSLPAETRQFDVLETEALNPLHPAHQYFNERNQRMLERIRPIVEREYASPDEVMTLLGLIFDGFRLKSVREAGKHWTEDIEAWKIAYKALDSFPRKQSSES
ncbi:AcrR family transcriptional regulator [Arthrobacter woluwensis]|nr:AcrR family transcriptional regulator [Arthrobacter woluwensis]